MFAPGSPVAAFVDERCVIGPDFEIPTEALRGRYTEWSKARGLPPADAGVFGKRLMSACPKGPCGAVPQARRRPRRPRLPSIAASP